MSRPFGSKNKHHKKITPKKYKKSKKSKKYKKHLKRGRPKGSKNKVYKVKIPEEPKRKRGRPKNPVVAIELPPASIIKKSKFLGFCPKCKAMICKNDLESQFIFACSCGHRARIKTLKKDMGSEKFTSKKDYLNAVIDSKHVEMLPLNEPDLGSIKVVD
jgi:acetyl-CoA carboxylase beta subunit